MRLDWSIYTLHDPRDPPLTRYVGWARIPGRRYKGHLRDARNGRDKTRCGFWKRSLLAAGVLPVMTVIESGTGSGYVAAERRWIAYYRSLCGGKLTNLTDGGDGTLGYQMTPDQRAKISAARRGTKATPAARAAMSAAHLGYKHTPDQTAKIAAANRGRHQPEEERAKRRKPRAPEAVAKSAAAKRGVRRSDESRAKMREAHLGKPLTAEHARNAAEAHLGLKRSSEAKAKISHAIKAWHECRKNGEAV